MTWWDFPYPSQRMPVFADNVVATSQPLAVQAGLEMLRRGGNAIDAALAAAIALTVVEPTSNGIGADAFAMVWDGQRLHGCNASGRSPAGLDSERFIGRGAMPYRGWDAVTVPGAVSAWAALSERFGALAFDELFQPAIGYAEHGWIVSPITAAAWSRAPAAYAGFGDFADAFLPGGRAPVAGERFACPEQADTLRAIAATGGEDFYRGALAERIAACAADAGAALRGEDLASHACEWVQPLALAHAGFTVHEMPPNGQGIAALAALGILARTPVAQHPPESAASIHLQVEAMKLAFADAHRYVADPDWLEDDPRALLDPDYLAQRAAMIDPDRAADPGHGWPHRGGTVYLAAADADGRMVSFIQSNYAGFGSGVVVPGTGIALQNRAAGFDTDPDSPNRVAPAKRPFHTIIPAFASDAHGPCLAFGVMGGHMQPQGHVQMVQRLAVHGQNVQAASDAPRWRADGGMALALESGFESATVRALAGLGHEVRVAAPGVSGDMFGFGGAQLVQRLPDGWVAASDSRKDGCAAGF